MSQQDDSLEEDSDFQELEQKLSGLKPLAPSEAFTARVGQRLDAMDQARVEDKIVWMRFAPVAAAACVVLTSAFLFRDHLLQQQRIAGAEENSDPGVAATTPATASQPAPVLNDNATIELPFSEPDGRFLPVSEGTFLHDAHDAGIEIDDRGQAVRRWEIELENTQHLFDPKTNTTIRFFSPQKELILVPVETD